MAGFFGLFNFWKFIVINLVYGLISLPVLTNGLASAGLTNVTRNIARDKHSFGVSDLWDTVKKNWKQALPAGIIKLVIYIILGFDVYFFYFGSKGIMSTIGLGISLCMLFIFTVMDYFVWTLIITFKFSLKQIYRNSFKFVFINMKMNLVCFFSILLVYAANVGILFLASDYYIVALTFEILLVQFCTFPSIKKCIIDPYYRDHPDEDLDKRRDLGIEVEEKKPEKTEDGEESDEEPENVFED